MTFNFWHPIQNFQVAFNMDQMCSQYLTKLNSKQSLNMPVSRLRLNYDIEEDDALLMILMFSLMLSVMLPLCMIAAPYILQDSSSLTLLVFLIFLIPGIMLSSSNIRQFLSEVVNNY